ncbi:E3 ubiquitin-protein ligase XIAP-like isoform X2 [Dreissena polymorpha]|uniref:E3 ubiquitin-protein ligase XIAP-like isoform X2 n=1 Tax=Dreissena polymorpha TaxID=45954 RepID=UPI002263BEA6|nr:E3 ubiquitin-protein ligase XIAP-like isoform X2 [Dreissena polymorpha]
MITELYRTRMISRKTYRCRIGYFRTVGYTGPVAVKGREQVFHGDLWSQNDLRFIVTMAGIVYGIAQILPLSVIQIQLLISGLEPNPGPLTANSKVIEMNTDILESSDVGKRTRVQPYRPNVSSAEVTEHGCALFRLEMNDKRKKDLNNKNNLDLQLREFSIVLDDIHNLGTRTELEISPLIYISKKQLFVMFPMSLWWKRLHFSEAAKCPNVGLAYRNDMGQSVCCTEPRFGQLENRIYNETIQSIKHDDLMPIFGGFEKLRHNLNRHQILRPNLTDCVFNNLPFELDVNDNKQQKMHNEQPCMLNLKGGYPQNDYMKWTHRMGSLTRFTTSTTEPQREDLCAAGFFSETAWVQNYQTDWSAERLGFEDQAQCFSCGYFVNEWKPAEYSWIEHCQWFPSCSYAKAENCDEFINLIEFSNRLTAVESFLQDDGTNRAGATINIDKRVIQQVVEKHQNVIICDMGFREDDVRNAVLKLLQGGIEDPDIEDIVMHLKMINEITCLIEQFETQQPLVPAPTGALLEIKQNFCHICKQNPVDALFLPCTHHKFCMRCTEHSGICTYCGRPIKQRIRTTYMNYM